MIQGNSTIFVVACRNKNKVFVMENTMLQTSSFCFFQSKNGCTEVSGEILGFSIVLLA